MNAPAGPVKPNAVVRIGEKIAIGNELPITFICGPCQLESRDHALETADFLNSLFSKLGAGLIYKTSFDKANRSSLNTKRGAGLDSSLPVFAEIKKRFGIPVLTDVHLPEQCAEAATVVDVLQIPAFLSRQTDLLVAAAQTGAVVNIKKGQFLAPWDMKNVLGKVTGVGNPNVLLTERGVSFGYNTLVNDFRGLAPGDALAPFSLVCKAVSANGRPTVKLSDNPNKAMGPADEVARYKRVFGVGAQQALKVEV